MPGFSQIQQYLFRKPYGIHSPFLFAFSNECIFNHSNEPEFTLLEKIRGELKGDKQQIQVIDFGQGPRLGKRARGKQPLTYSRRVNSIAHSSLQKPKYCRVIFRMVRYFKPSVVLELGTSLGLSASYMALADPSTRVITLEGCPGTSGKAHSTFQRAKATNTELITGPFSHTLPGVLETLPADAMVYIDGDHSFEAVLANFTAISNRLGNNGIIIVDDIRWSGQMRAAWKQMAQWPKTTLALDLGKIGILFFNPALSKQLIRIAY